MVNQYLLDKLMSLIKQGVVSISDIKMQEYKDSTISEFKNEVVNRVITADQYKQYTELDY